MTNHKTTFNYLLTHTVIPQYVLPRLDDFYEKNLSNPDSMQHFMQTAVEMAAALAQGKPDREAPYPMGQFEMGIYGESFERSFICIRIPNAKADCDCTDIAFPVMRKCAGYFTSELALHPLTNKMCLFLGGWAYENGNFSHLNYGEIDAKNGKNFLGMITEIAYGKKNH